jgi:hypothetical protein
MAIIHKGAMLLSGEPRKEVNELKGKIWKSEIEKTRLPDLRKKYAVVSTTLFAGKTVLRIYSETKPDSGFELAEPELDDVYFTTIKLSEKEFKA